MTAPNRRSYPLTLGQKLAIQHVMRHSLAKPFAECSKCKRLRRRLERGF